MGSFGSLTSWAPTVAGHLETRTPCCQRRVLLTTANADQGNGLIFGGRRRCRYGLRYKVYVWDATPDRVIHGVLMKGRSSSGAYWSYCETDVRTNRILAVRDLVQMHVELARSSS